MNTQTHAHHKHTETVTDRDCADCCVNEASHISSVISLHQLKLGHLHAWLVAKLEMGIQISIVFFFYLIKYKKFWGLPEK